MDEKVLMSELGIWNDEKVLVEPMDTSIRYTPIGDKAIVINYSSIVSCNRYMNEFDVTSRDAKNGVYGICYVPIRFGSREMAEKIYHLVSGKAANLIQSKESDEFAYCNDEEKPIFIFECLNGFFEGVLKIYDNNLIFNCTNVENKDIEIAYKDVVEVKKNFGSIRIDLSNNTFQCFQVPKVIFHDLLSFLQMRVEEEHKKIIKLS